MSNSLYIKLEEPLGLAVLDTVAYLEEGWFIITRLNVPKPHRGKGVARKLMELACANADLYGHRILLEVTPSDELNYEQLVNFYTKFGFEFHPILRIMLRRPLLQNKAGVPPLSLLGSGETAPDQGTE